RDQITADMILLVPPNAQALVQSILQDLVRERSSTLLSVGVAAAIWTASSGMMAIIRTLNKAYRVTERRPYWQVRLIAIGYTIAFTMSVLLAFILLVFGQLLG